MKNWGRNAMHFVASISSIEAKKVDLKESKEVQTVDRLDMKHSQTLSRISKQCNEQDEIPIQI